jgi:predicted nucleotidyltransferase
MINAKLMEKFLEKASQKLTGEWVIIGGTVLPLTGIEHRITVDIDIVNLNFNSSNQDSIQLMEIADELKLPVESINQAGAYYLSKMGDINEHLILLIKTKSCKIYRPDVFLFLKLKLERLSSTDLEDCIHFINKHAEEYKKYQKQISKLIMQKSKTATTEQKQRLDELLAHKLK